MRRACEPYAHDQPHPNRASTQRALTPQHRGASAFHEPARSGRLGSSLDRSLLLEAPDDMEQQPDANILAYLALLLSVPATFAAFACLKPTKAVLVVLLGTQLFLPEVVCFDAPLVPPLNKQSLPALCMFLALLFTARGRIAKARPGRGIDSLMFLALLAIVGTVVTNRDALRYGPTTLPAHTPSDVLSEAIRTATILVNGTMSSL